MTTTNFSYNQIKAGIVGHCIGNINTSPTQINFVNSNWTGWITGTDCTVNYYASAGSQGANNNPFWVVIDGAVAISPNTTIVGGRKVTAIFSGLTDTKHYVQIFTGVVYGSLIGFNVGDTDCMVVTGSSPAIENFGDHSVSWLMGDPNFPGTDSHMLSPQDNTPYVANAKYFYNKTCTLNGNAYRMANPNGNIRKAGSGSGPSGTGQKIGDGECLWNYVGTASSTIQNIPFSTTPSAIVPLTTLGFAAQVLGVNSVPNGGATTVFRGYGSEVWVQASYPLVSAQQGTNLFAQTTGITGTAGSYTIPITVVSATSTAFVGSVPSGFTITNAQVLWTTAVTAGQYVLPISCSSSTDTTYFTLIVTINPIANAPQIVSPNNTTAVAGNAFTYKINATYGITASFPATSYSATNLPAGLTLDTSSGIISGTPTTAGNTTATISAINSTGTGTINLNFSITVANAPTFPQLKYAYGASGTIYVPWFFKSKVANYQVRATGTPTGFTVTSGTLPTGLTLNSATGQITGTPITAGQSIVTITATNANGSSSAIYVFAVYTDTQISVSTLNSSGCCTLISIDGGDYYDAKLNVGYSSTELSSLNMYNGQCAGWFRVADNLDNTLHTICIYDRSGINAVAFRNPTGTPSFVRTKLPQSIQFGDSVTYGAASVPTECATLAQMGVSGVNVGISGETVAQAQQRLVNNINSYKCLGRNVDFIINATGRNDSAFTQWVSGLTTGTNTGTRTILSGDNLYIGDTVNRAMGTQTPSSLTNNLRIDFGGLVDDNGTCFHADIPSAQWYPSVSSPNYYNNTISEYQASTLLQNSGNVYYVSVGGTSVNPPTGTSTGNASITPDGTGAGVAKYQCVSASGPWVASTSVTAGTILNTGVENYYYDTSGTTGTVAPSGTASETGTFADGTATCHCCSVLIPNANGGVQPSITVRLPNKYYDQYQVAFNFGHAYYASTLGITGSGTGPTGTDTVNPVTDGTVQWIYTPWHGHGRYAMLLRTMLSLGKPVISRTSIINNTSGAVFDPTIKKGIALANNPLIKYIDPSWGANLTINWGTNFDSPDKTHPSPEGYKKIGLLIERDYAPYLNNINTIGLSF